MWMRVNKYMAKFRLLHYNLAQTNLPGPSMESEGRLLEITLLQLTNIAMVIGWDSELTNHMG